MDLIVVGAGEVTRQLLRRLGEAWDVVVVDTSEEQLEQLRGARLFEARVGDGSSAVTLRDAGLTKQTDAVIAATRTDEVNLEVCRIAREAGVRRVMAVVADPARTPEYRELDVPVLAPAQVSAREIEDFLQARRVASKTFAEGKIEAMEFAVAPTSAVRGMTVAELQERDLLLAAILRKGELVSRDPETALEAGDLVTVIGSAVELPELVRAFTSGSPRFPLDYGKRVVVGVASDAERESTLREAVLVTKNSKATSLLAIVSEDQAPEGDGDEDDEDDEDASPGGTASTFEQELEGVEVSVRVVDRRPDRVLWGLPGQESVGLLVVSRPVGPFARWRARRVLLRARQTRTPVLFARGRRAYGRIMVAARRSPSGRAAARAAIDLAELSKSTLTAIAVADPEFMAGPRAEEEAGRAVDWVEAQASLYGLEATTSVRQGNAVKAFLGAGERADLLVLGLADTREPFQLTLLSHLARDGHPSILVVPSRT